MIKNLYVLLISVISIPFFYTCGTAQQTIDADNPAIIYSGRFDFTNPKALEFGYSSCRIRTKFEGTSIKMKISSTENVNYVLAIIDSVELPKLTVQTSTTELTIASGLKDTIHTIEIIKITACAQGSCVFKGFTLDAGKNVLAGITPETRKIHFIGNSITCGYGIEVLSNALHYDPATENSYEAYATQTARALHADYNLVSRSGIGMYRNYGDPTTGSADNMYSIYNRTFHNKTAPLWDFNKYQPDVVCVNLGTNDFSQNKGDETLFSTQYSKFIDTLRLKYPQAKIVLLMGPMLNTSAFKNVLTSLVSKHKTAGDNNISMFELTAQGALGYGADWHPSRAQARKNSGELIDYLKLLTGWDSYPIVQTVNTSNGGTSIDIELNDSIQPTTTIKGFEVKIDNNPTPIDSIVLLNGKGKTIRMYLKTRIKQTQKININYIKGNIKNLNGLPLLPITELLVNNTVVDIRIISNRTSKNSLSIQLNRAISPVNCDFFSIIDSKNNAITIDSLKISVSTITFYVAQNLPSNDSIFIAYNGTCIKAADNVPLYPIVRYGIKCTTTQQKTVSENEQEIRFFPNPVGKNGLNIQSRTAIDKCLEVSVFGVDGKSYFIDSMCSQDFFVPSSVFTSKTKQYIVSVTGVMNNNTFVKSTIIAQ